MIYQGQADPHGADREAENIYLGRMPVNRFGVINTRKANEMAKRIIEDFGLPIEPDVKVKDLSIAYQQMVEIMKAYSREKSEGDLLLTSPRQAFAIRD